MINVTIENLDEIAKKLSRLPDVMMSAVKITGEAAKYALVWEWGSSRISKPGPKTTWGINPAGQRVILTKTAPTGYINKNKRAIRDAMHATMKKLDLGGTPIDQWDRKIYLAIVEVCVKAAVLIDRSAPVDTGQLRDSIQPAPEVAMSTMMGISANVGSRFQRNILVKRAMRKAR